MNPRDGQVSNLRFRPRKGQAMRLNRDKRYQIKALLNVGLLQKDIANQVGMTPGALSKELNRNGGKDKYDPDKADNRARKLARKNHVHYKFSDEVWAETEALIMEDLWKRRGERGHERLSPRIPVQRDLVGEPQGLKQNGSGGEIAS